MAASLACQFDRYVSLENVPFYERMIRESAWWDVCDNITPNIIGRLIAKHPEETFKVLDKWIQDEHLWIRRAALLAQENLGEKTDGKKLLEYC